MYCHVTCCRATQSCFPAACFTLLKSTVLAIIGISVDKLLRISSWRAALPIAWLSLIKCPCPHYRWLVHRASETDQPELDYCSLNIQTVWYQWARSRKWFTREHFVGRLVIFGRFFGSHIIGDHVSKDELDSTALSSYAFQQFALKRFVTIFSVRIVASNHDLTRSLISEAYIYLWIVKALCKNLNLNHWSEKKIHCSYR